MLRVPLSLAVLLSALFALTAAAEAAETWEPADKQAFGTAHDLRSKVWFTLGRRGWTRCTGRGSTGPPCGRST